MYKFLIVCLTILIVSCKSDKAPKAYAMAGADIKAETALTEATVVDQPALFPEPYELGFTMNKLENNFYDFEVSMVLHNGAHYISPNAVREFKGKFTIKMDDTDKLETIDGLIETPRSVEEIDPHPFTNGTVNWVRENTTYHQKLKPTVDSNFEVKGFIQFTIEPRCTLEKVPFIIKYVGGDMRVELFGC